MTIKEIRNAMRNADEMQTILIKGWGQVQKIGGRYAVGPLPENDDSDPSTDYSAWCYGWKESWVLNSIREKLNIA